MYNMYNMYIYCVVWLPYFVLFFYMNKDGILSEGEDVTSFALIG